MPPLRVAVLCLTALALAIAAGGVAEPPTFDYVVVGAGAAGSVVASRLTEDPGVTVLVLEAGGPDTDPRIHRPSAYRELPGSELDWGYQTEEEPGLGGRRIAWPRGKVWGGSGSLSATVYLRGHPRDFDAWEAMGNPGWAWDDVLPWFRKAENHERGPSALHGAGGPQNVADPRWVPPLSRAFLEAAVQAGLRRHDDFNGEAQDGASLFAVNQRNGERHSAAAAYLRPALHRANLSVVSHALAGRVLVERGRAAGVSYLREGRERVARASREVILCAGAIGSPQLLLLSGIGPAEHLRSLGLPVVRDLPGVGENLQDHPRVAVTYESAESLALSDAEWERALRDYARDRSGPLSSTGVGAGAFVRTTADEKAPDVLIVPTANPGANAWSLHVALMRPRSRGTLRLRSKEPEAHPLIRAGYLSDEGDKDVLVRGLAVARRLAGQDALARFRGRELAPGPGREGEALARFVRENATTFFHPVGTCRMGSDRLAVVDQELRVHGVAGLRVVDASVMPALVAGASHAATVMIAEKAADLVKESASPQRGEAIAGSPARAPSLRLR
jgi:choline dehydrogenase